MALVSGGADIALLRTVNAVTAQVEAMGGDIFEIGLLKPEASGEPPMLLRTWDIQTLLRSVPWLRYQNSTGRHIYIRPHGENNLTILDDLVPDKVSQLFQKGYEPAAVVRTSPGNFQVWLKHPERLSKELGTTIAKLLAQRFESDLGSADWHHFGRLSGFANRKTKHRREDGSFPFVILESGSGAVYSKADQVLSETKILLEANRREQEARSKFFAQHIPTTDAIRSIDEFRHDARYGGDGNRVDLAYAIHALSRGRGENEVAADLRSRDLKHKGSEARQNQYVTRTIQKAIGRLAGERGQDRCW